MTEASEERDLLVLAADRNMEAAVRAVLGRPQALRIRPLDFQVRRHPQHDSGCLLHGASYVNAFRHVRRPRSSALYAALGEKVSVERCSDRAFLKLKTTLRNWFGEG